MPRCTTNSIKSSSRNEASLQRETLCCFSRVACSRGIDRPRTMAVAVHVESLRYFDTAALKHPSARRPNRMRKRAPTHMRSEWGRAPVRKGATRRCHWGWQRAAVDRRPVANEVLLPGCSLGQRGRIVMSASHAPAVMPSRKAQRNARSMNVPTAVRGLAKQSDNENQRGGKDERPSQLGALIPGGILLEIADVCPGPGAVIISAAPRQPAPQCGLLML
jgi:hypothetical protein